MSAIEVRKLVKSFNGQKVLHDIDLDVAAGEVVAIIGPSGSGKTTLLRSINLLEVPDSGTIRVGEITVDAALAQSKQKEQVRRLRQQVGFVFQNFNLFPHRSVMENIIEGPVIVKGEPKTDAVARARTLLGWKPQVPLSEGLAATYAWFEEEMGGAATGIGQGRS